MTGTSFQDTGPERDNRITLETKSLTSVDPKILSAFFEKEAAALAESIEADNLDSRLVTIYRSVYEQCRQPLQSIILLQSRAEDFNDRRERIINASQKVPELTTMVTDRTAEGIAEEWERNVDTFLSLKSGLLSRIQLYGQGSRTELSGPRALNTQFSEFSDADRDMILKKAFRKNPELAFWDITFGLKLQHLEHTQALTLTNFLEDYRSVIAQNQDQPGTVKPAIEASKELNSILADLPTAQVPTHLLGSFQNTVQEHFATRVSRAFRSISPK